MACATASRAWLWPTTRRSIASRRLSTVRISSVCMRRAGMPVHASTIAAIAWPSTMGKMSGCSPCSARRRVDRSASSARSVWPSLLAAPSPAPPVVAVAASIFARTASILVTRSRSASQRSFSLASSSVMRCRSAVKSLRRVAWSAPAAVSRSMIFSSVSIRPSRRWQSSIGAGMAFWLIATRAQAVSIRLTALSGNWRAGM